VTTDAARWVRIFPLNRPGTGRIGINIATQLASQIGHRGEDAAGDDLSLDSGEPQFDLIQPRGICGREVEAHMGILFQKFPDQSRLVR